MAGAMIETGPATGAPPGALCGARGFTLLELLLVLVLVGILAGVANWGGRHLVQSWQLKRAGHQLLEDLKAVQARAEMSGQLALSDGALMQQNSFVVFDAADGSYAAFAWQDRNEDGVADTGESVPLWGKTLPPGVSFGWALGISRRACSNAAGSPGGAISFASPAYQPCSNRPCLKFDCHGFSVIGPGAIYLRDGAKYLAITGTLPGQFTLCEWDGERWH